MAFFLRLDLNSYKTILDSKNNNKPLSKVLLLKAATTKLDLNLIPKGMRERNGGVDLPLSVFAAAETLKDFFEKYLNEIGSLKTNNAQIEIELNNNGNNSLIFYSNSSFTATNALNLWGVGNGTEVQLVLTYADGSVLNDFVSLQWSNGIADYSSNFSSNDVGALAQSAIEQSLFRDDKDETSLGQGVFNVWFEGAKGCHSLPQSYTSNDWVSAFNGIYVELQGGQEMSVYERIAIQFDGRYDAYIKVIPRKESLKDFPDYATFITQPSPNIFKIFKSDTTQNVGNLMIQKFPYQPELYRYILCF